MKIHEGLFFRRWTDAIGSTLQAIALYIYIERCHILKYCHDNQTAGHLGVTKTLDKIRQKYYRPGLQRDVRLYKAEFEECSIKTKTSTYADSRSRYAYGTHRHGHPGRAAVYIPGIKGISIQCTLVVSCYLEARTVAEFVVQEVVTRFGVTYTIDSDYGRQFEGKAFTEMRKLLRVKKTRTTPHILTLM